MSVVLFLIALVCVAGGGAALFTGFDILLGERGLPIIVGGSALLASGIVLFGLLAVTRAVRRLERAVVDRLEAQIEAARLGADAAPPLAIVAPGPALHPSPELGVAPAGALAAENEREEPAGSVPLAGRSPPGFDDTAEVSVPDQEGALGQTDHGAPGDEASIVGRYSSAGNSYVMFSDGMIEADTPTGKHRFHSIDELRAFVAAGGEGTPAA